MKKTLITICSIFIIAVIGFGLYVFFFKPKSISPALVAPSSGVLGPIQPVPQAQIPTSAKISLKNDGGDIIVNNFIKTAEKIIQTSVYLKSTKEYDIIYNTDSGTFLISIFAFTPDKADIFRLQAEEDLVLALGVSKNTLCGLVVNSQVPPSYDTELANTNYHLSFCPNGIPVTSKQPTNNNIR